MITYQEGFNVVICLALLWMAWGNMKTTQALKLITKLIGKIGEYIEKKEGVKIEK